MRTLKNKKGVTLISLAVTIIILLILAGTIISDIVENKGIISAAIKSKTKSYLSIIKEEYNLYLSSKNFEESYDSSTLYADSSIIRYNGNKVGNSINEICKSIKSGDEDTFQIIRGKIYYISKSKLEIEVARQLGFEINPYSITKDGVLEASVMNLFLTDIDGNLDLSEYEGVITAIEAGAFSNIAIENGINPLKSIILPKGIKSIGDDAFSHNSDLETIVIPDSVESIGKRAFQSCTKLKNINIPDSVTYIGDYCFAYCSSLQWIKLSNNIKNINQRLLTGCYSLTSIDIPEGVESIGYSAFGSCNKITSISLPATLKSFDGTSLAGLPKLTDISISPQNNNFKFENGILLSKDGKKMYMALLTLKEINVPDEVESIVGDTLSGSSATKIILPSSVKSGISGTVFNGMSNLKTIEVSKNSVNLKVVDGNLYSYDGKRFIKYMGTSRIFTIPEGVESLSSRCITKTMNTLKLPSTLKTIEKWALASMGGVSLLNIPASVTTMYTVSFASDTKIRVDSNNQTYQSIDDTLILDKQGTKLMLVSRANQTYVIPNTVTEINNEAFFNCTKMISIIIPNSVTIIGSNAFYNCTSLRQIDIPASVTTIGSNAFVYCTNLVSININKEKGKISGSPWGAQFGNRAINWIT